MSAPGDKASATDVRKQVWTETFGTHPSNVQIIERIEKGLEIYLRFKHPKKVEAGARDARTWRATGLRARSELGQKLKRKVQDEARELAKQLELDLRNGKFDDGAATAAVEAAVADTPSVLPAISGAPSSAPASSNGAELLTLADGLAKATALDGTGSLHAPLDADGNRAPNRETREILARSRTFLRIMEQYAQKLEQPMPTWAEFTAVHADYVIKTLADEHVATSMHGYTTAIRMIDEFYRAARWLKEHELIPADRCKPRHQWKVAAKKLWEKTTATEVKRRSLRHSADDMQAIFATLDDPRGHLATVLTRGKRLALYADRKRSHLRLEPTPRIPHGGMILNEGPTNIYVRRFNARERAAIDFALATGYLRACEQAYVGGEIEDYYFFPSGQLVREGNADGLVSPHDPRALHLPAHGANVLTIDPRSRLATELGAALRLGQVYRTRRSQVHLEASVFVPDEGDLVADSLGTVEVEGRGNKRSPGLALSSAMAQALDDALSGYLVEFEALYRAGEIADYYLFPGGRLTNGIAKPGSKHADQPASRDVCLHWFRELESAAGVDHVAGRGWNGLRRLFTDVAPKYTANETTLNAHAGTSTKMREEVYKERESLEAKVDAARVSDAIRRDVRAAVAAPKKRGVTLDRSLAHDLQAYTPEEVRAALRLLEQSRASSQDDAAASLASPVSAEKRGLVDPAVDPNEKARVHGGTQASRFPSENHENTQERAMGLEPTTSSLGSWHSTN